MKPIKRSLPNPDAPASEIVAYLINGTDDSVDAESLWKDVTFAHMERLIGYVRNLRKCGVVFTQDLLENILWSYPPPPPPLEGNHSYEKISDYLNWLHDNPTKLESW